MRKTSRDERCERQAVKQDHAAKTASAIKVPRVLDWWDGESFTMEYVPGIPLGEFLQTSSLDECSRVCASLVAFIDGNWAGHDSSDWREAFDTKLAALRSNGAPHGSLITRAIELLRHVVPTLVLPAGPNHGDLSFENVLITPQDVGVWCVDFLDSPFESPLLDIGRLLVDAEHGWWRTAYQATGAEVIGRKSLSRALRTLCVKREVPQVTISAMKTFAALRVLPYSLDPARIAILLDVLTAEIPQLQAEERP